MRLLNPSFVFVSPVSAADKIALQNALTSLAAVAEPDFDVIRAALPPARRATFTDGFLMQAATELGIGVKGFF